MKQSGKAKIMNVITSVVVIVVGVMLVTGGGDLITSMFEQRSDPNYEKARAAMPLHIEDIKELHDVKYEYEWDSTKTFIMGSQTGKQDVTEEYYEDDDESSNGKNKDLEDDTYYMLYEIVNVRPGKLYNKCLKRWIKERFAFIDEGITPGDPSKYVAVDAAP